MRCCICLSWSPNHNHPIKLHSYGTLITRNKYKDRLSGIEQVAGWSHFLPINCGESLYKYKLMKMTLKCTHAQFMENFTTAWTCGDPQWTFSERKRTFMVGSPPLFREQFFFPPFSFNSPHLISVVPLASLGLLHNLSIPLGKIK